MKSGLIHIPLVPLFRGVVEICASWFAGAEIIYDRIGESSETGSNTKVTDSYSTDNGKTLQTLRSGTPGR